MAGTDDEEEDFPATQPVMAVLLAGVTAYVEVRSGHDNRSKGVKAHMRTLGAKIEETLNKKVTHVVFNEGLPSTYKKAKKFNCHLVSVLWIEACKEARSKVSEAGYPPIGQQIYENPDSLKNFKKMKSMQPDSDDEAVEIKTKKMLKRIANYRQRRQLIANATNDSNKAATEKKGQPRASKKSTRSKAASKKTALQEITPDVVNKATTCEAAGDQPDETTTENVAPLVVVDLTTSPQAPAPAKRRPSKSKKASDDTPITRREFIQSLNEIHIAEPRERESPLEPSDISPWRRGVGPPPVKIRRKNPTAKRVSPRRSPQAASDTSSDCFLFPAVPARRSPRQVSGITKLSKNVPAKASAAPSASVALMRSKKPVPPPSPGDDFILLSQEPGDMPSIDEMAKMRKGAIKAGDECISLSQIVRSYNAVAEGHSKSATPGSSRVSSQVSNKNPTRKSSISQGALDDTIEVDVEEDMACDNEVRGCVSRCSSEAGSSVSSTSTRVVINGKPPSEVGCSSHYLPSSGEIGDEQSENIDTPDALDREPSPIFVIKKFRKPLKKQVNVPKYCDPKSGTEKKSSGTTLKDSSSSSEDKRQSLNPLDYINQMLLPKFGSKTPANSEMGKVLVEETPEINSLAKCDNPQIIPPTPLENPSLNQSLTSSVISWVKKSCRVPLFSSNSKKGAVPPPSEGKKLNSSKEEPNDLAPLSQGSTASIYYSFSKETDARAEAENPPNEKTSISVNTPLVSSKTSKSSARKNLHSPHSPSSEKTTASTSEGENQSTRKSARKKNVIKTPYWKKVSTTPKSGGNLESITMHETSSANPDGKASSASKGTKLHKPRSKVIVTVLKNDDDKTSNNSVATEEKKASSPVVRIQKAHEAHGSSGYETSNSVTSNTDTEENQDKKDMKGKPKKITDLLSPINGPTKKRSDIYENGSTTSSPLTDKSTDTIHSVRQRGRKRIQSLPEQESKRPKLNSSESDCPRESRKTRSTVVDGNNALTLSRSDLSSDSIKSSSRKSSEEARKRMAVSLTRNYKSNALKVIVCTFLTTSEQNGIDAAGSQLGGWKLEQKVTPRTTHVINSGPKRTINMLKGMARGCWLVDQQWMLDSAKAGTWLEEDKYELTRFSSAVRPCRMLRQAMGKDFKHNLFSRCGPIYVSPKIDGPPAKDIRELLELSGADLKTSLKEAKIVVGDEPSHKGSFTCVEPRWVLDSITQNKVLPMK